MRSPMSQRSVVDAESLGTVWDSVSGLRSSSEKGFIGVLHGQWRVPSVDETRPEPCPVCAVASRTLDSKLNLWGHGLHERPVDDDAAGGDSSSVLRGSGDRLGDGAVCAADGTASVFPTSR